MRLCENCGIGIGVDRTIGKYKDTMTVYVEGIVEVDGSFYCSEDCAIEWTRESDEEEEKEERDEDDRENYDEEQARESREDTEG